MKYFKKHWKGALVALFLSLATAYGSFYLELWELDRREDVSISGMKEDVKFFHDHSKILDHRIENGKLLLKV